MEAKSSESPSEHVEFDFGYKSDSESESDVGYPDDIHSVGPVKFFTHELSFRGRLRRFFIRNPTTRLVSTFFDLAVKIIVCSVYVVRVIMDNPAQYACRGKPCGGGANDTNETEVSDDSAMKFSSTHINWYVLIWVNRPLAVWIVEVVLAFISLAKDLLFIYITTKGHRLEQVLTKGFLLELLCTLPMLCTVFYPPLLQHFFVPNFLNCWLGKRALERIFNDLHLTRQRFQTISVTLSQQMVMLLASLICLVFTTICGIQHIQRGSFESPLTMFESLYFVIVTFSTVGYGDISPDIWLGQVFIMIMIIVAFTFIPRQVEVLASTWLERQKVGGEYSRRAAQRNKHVIVCSSALTQETVMDFLNEFYAHPKLEEHMVLLLCPQELDSSMQVILKDPKWTHRVIYMKGSALKDIDLKRCRIQQAEACFFLAPRPTSDKNKADQHTVLRSWAVKDFAPHCKQYIQLFKAKNKMHVKFAEHLVCEDEFKYALLANNCLYPGLSTLVSLLVHTSSGLLQQFLKPSEGDIAPHPWQQIYGRHSGNEIYHVQLGKSVFFSQYEGCKFTHASAEAHQRFNVTLLAVLVGDGSTSRRLQLNPGSEYILKKEDFCFYMSVTREEYTEINPQAVTSKPSQTRLDENLKLIAEALKKFESKDSPELETESEDCDMTVFDTITSLMGKDITRTIQQRNKSSPAYKELMNNNSQGASESSRPLLADHRSMQGIGETGSVSFADIETDIHAEGDQQSENNLVEMDHRHGAGKVLQYYNDMGQEKLTTGPPPVTIYMGSQRAVCHKMRESRPFCCLEWGTDCEHCMYKNANDERWHHQLIIVAAQKASSGIHNFVVPLRSSFIAINGLSPIVLLLETDPDPIFLDTIAQFPLVYWMKGSITSLDDMLRAGINKASHLVVVNRESNQNMAGEETLADAETIIAVQTVFRMFPNANIITELSQASNMRFMQFSAQDIYLQKVSRLEQKLKETMTSNLNHIFRMPFAAGQVFSASMLDTLLYQTFVKGYLITFVRLLLGIDAEEGSGHLSSIRIKRSTLNKFPTYGELYQGLCSATGEIPIAVYRTERSNVALKSDSDNEVEVSSTNKTKKGKKLSRKPSHTTNPFAVFNKSEIVDIGGLVRNRLKSLDMSAKDYSEVRKRPNTISYVIANPSPKRKLKVGDIIYVIQPSSMKAKPSKQKFWPQRSHSFSGVIHKKTELPSRPANSATVYVPIKTKKDVPDSAPAAGSSPTSGGSRRIGRFELKRYNSEKGSNPSVKEV
ncbi:potassium channel subfamily T member 2-like isoform X2 [Littorina saxatilis]|uniref:potassium channel subfamily T member 2-like isoform X2 n=1 Tax=Littorina saxatilis TaxID=31220 RepID=UPI0038B50EAA